MPPTTQSYSERELLLLLNQKVDTLLDRIKDLDSRQLATERQLREHEAQIGTAMRSAAAANKLADDALGKARQSLERIEQLEEGQQIDGDDGKRLTIREAFVRQWRANTTMRRRLAALALVIPVISEVLNRLLNVWVP